MESLENNGLKPREGGGEGGSEGGREVGRDGGRRMGGRKRKGGRKEGVKLMGEQEWKAKIVNPQIPLQIPLQ